MKKFTPIKETSKTSRKLPALGSLQAKLVLHYRANFQTSSFYINIKNYFFYIKYIPKPIFIFLPKNREVWKFGVKPNTTLVYKLPDLGSFLEVRSLQNYSIYN